MKIIRLIISAVFVSYFFILLPLDYARGIKPEDAQISMCQKESCDELGLEFWNSFNLNYQFSGFINMDGNRNFCTEIVAIIPTTEPHEVINILDLFRDRGLLKYRMDAEKVSISAGARVDNLLDILYNFIGGKMSCYPRYFGSKMMLAVMILYFILLPIMDLLYRRTFKNVR